MLYFDPFADKISSLLVAKNESTLTGFSLETLVNIAPLIIFSFKHDNRILVAIPPEEELNLILASVAYPIYIFLNLPIMLSLISD